MKKNLYTLFICLGLVFSTNAQNLKKNLDLQVGEVIDVNGNQSNLRVIEGEDGRFYAIDFEPKGFKKGLRIIEFNSDMREMNRSDISLEINKEKLRFQDLFYNNSRLTLITSTFYKKGKQIEIFFQDIDPKNLKPTSQPKLLTQFLPDGKKTNVYGYKTNFSPDGNKLLVFRDESEGKKDIAKYHISVFDANDNFIELWSQNYEADAIDNLEDVQSYKVNDEGDVYLVIRQFEGKRKVSKNGQVNYKYKLQEYSDNGNAKNEFAVDLKDEYITQISIGINQNNDIICTGFYSSNTRNSIKGCFYLLMDHKTKSVVKESKKEFTLDFITSEMSEKNAAKVKKKKEKGKEVELPNFELQDIILSDDGGVIQVAERYYVTTHTYTDGNGNTRTTYVYHYDDLIVISIDPNGNIEWARKVQKRQAASRPYNPTLSYHLSVIGDKIYIFHNGNAENLIPNKKKKVKAFSTGKKSTGIITEINSEGYMRRDIFYDFAGHQAVALIRLTTDFENEILFMSNFKKKVKFLKLKIKD